MAAVDDGACAEEKQCLEKCMREQMKHPDSHSSHAEADHHQAQLTDGGIGKDTLDIILAKCNERSNERSNCAGPCNHG